MKWGGFLDAIFHKASLTHFRMYINVPRMSDYNTSDPLFVSIISFSDLNQAAEAAFQVKSVDDLNALLSKCANNRELTERIQARLSQLTYRR